MVNMPIACFRPYKDYSNNKILWQHDYKREVKKYYNYSPRTLINKGKKNYNLNDKFGFKYIEGTKKAMIFMGIILYTGKMEK